MLINKYFEINNGNVPIILSCVHGGYKKSKSIPDKIKGPTIADKNTYFLTKMIINGLKANNIEIYYILNKIHRSKIDLNRPPISNTAFMQGCIEALNIHNLFHDHIDRFTQDCILKYNRCLLIDIHGFTKPTLEYPDVIFGNVFGNTLRELETVTQNGNGRFWGYTQLKDALQEKFSLDDGLGISNFNFSYSGGYITQRFYNKVKVNAIQIEIAKYIRVNKDLIRKLVDSLILAISNSLENYALD